MRISKLTLTNFRAFKETQAIELAPITLLFGANSTGKSTILLALAYVQQILGKGHCDPQYLDAFGNRKIGGFRSLVSDHDLSKCIVIKVEVSVGNSVFEKYGLPESTFYSSSSMLNEFKMTDIAGSVDTFEVELTIKWSALLENAYVEQYRVWLNQNYIGCIESYNDTKNTFLTELNTTHQLLLPQDHEDWISNEPQKFLNYTYKNTGGIFKSLLELTLASLNPSRDTEPKKQDNTKSNSNFLNNISPIAVDTVYLGAIPKLNELLETNLDGMSLRRSNKELNKKIITSALSQAFILPLDKLLELLRESVFIGPLRCVPTLDYLPNPYLEQKHWADGTAAWDLLHRNPNSNKNSDLLDCINEWFSSEKKMNTGYELMNLALNQTSQEQSNLPLDQLSGLLNKRHVFFKNISTGTILPPNQLGTGISQVLPVIVAAHYVKKGLISIEQPELHIHPALQVEIADLFTKALDLSVTNAPTFLIETHSEHIMLRLLRRVRETTDGELAPDGQSVCPEDISVLFLEPSVDGVIVKKININTDGEFIDRWPKGFFGERAKELF